MDLELFGFKDPQFPLFEFLFYSLSFIYFLFIYLLLSFIYSLSSIITMISLRNQPQNPQPTLQHPHAPPPYSTHKPSHNNTPTQDSLPSYSSGTEIKPFSSLASTVSIQLDHPQSRIYDIDNLISGRVIFVPNRDCVLGSVSATLAGEERTIKTKWGGVSSQSLLDRKIKLGQHVVSPSTFPKNSICRKGYMYSFSFSIQVPLTHGGSKNKEPAQQQQELIPPSLGPSPDLLQGYFDCPTSIYYFVNASVMTLQVPEDRSAGQPVTIDNVYTCECPPFVTIIPSYPNFPKAPSYLEAINNYKAIQGEPKHNHNGKTANAVVASEEVRRRGLLKNPLLGVVDLLSSEEPLVISLDASDVSFTKLRLRFTPSGLSNQGALPPKITYVMSKLKAITTYAVCRDKSNESEATDTMGLEPSTTETVRHHTDSIPITQHSVSKPTWVRHTNTVDGTYYYTSKILVPFTMLPFTTTNCTTNNTLPSFKSKYISRHYELKFQLGVSPTSSSSNSSSTSSLPLKMSTSTNISITVPACVTASFLAKPHYRAAPILSILENNHGTSVGVC